MRLLGASAFEEIFDFRDCVNDLYGCLSTADALGDEAGLFLGDAAGLFLDKEAWFVSLGREISELVVVICSLTLARSIACCSLCFGQNLRKINQAESRKEGPHKVLKVSNICSRFSDQRQPISNFIHEKRCTVGRLKT